MSNTAIMPFLTYEDPKTAIAWLNEAFGIEPIDVTTGDDGQVSHAELRAGDGIILLTPANGSDLLPMRSPRQLPYTNAGVFVRIDKPEDVDKHHERAVAAGAKVLFPLADMPYGSREYTCQDLEGHVWSFGTYNPGKE